MIKAVVRIDGTLQMKNLVLNQLTHQACRELDGALEIVGVPLNSAGWAMRDIFNDPNRRWYEQ